MNLQNIHSSLLDLYAETARTIDAVESTIEDLDVEHLDPTPWEIKREHAEAAKERYDGPVRYLALLLLESNRREWLHRKSETLGASDVRRHGFTENQRLALDRLADAWAEYDDSCPETGGGSATEQGDAEQADR